MVSAGCPSAQPTAAPAPCASAASTLPADARGDGLAGEYRLTLVSTRGSRAGKSAGGLLRLAPYAAPAASGSTRTPLHGAATIAVDSVGAVAPGSITSTDPARPGVKVLEWRTADGS